MSEERPLRVLIAKGGLDGHDRGAKVVALLLRDAGMEVIYTGLRPSLDGIVGTAAQEDVDAVGLSILSGAHMRVTEALLAKMRERGIGDVPLVVGGNVPYRDRQQLLDLGAAAVLPTGTPLDEIPPAFRTACGRTEALVAEAPPDGTRSEPDPGAMAPVILESGSK